MIRVAATADVHYGEGSVRGLGRQWQSIGEDADVLLIAGDFTSHGRAEEAELLARELEELAVPVVSVLGNHDYHSGEEKEIRDVLEQARVRVLDGEAVTLDIGGTRVGIAGIKGFGGGFVGAAGAEFGENEMKAFIRHTRSEVERFASALAELEGDVRIGLLHYSPIEATLEGEHPALFPFLGTYMLADELDRAGVDIAFHGHAHAGAEEGTTPGGIPVRNVAQQVIGAPFKIYTLE